MEQHQEDEFEITPSTDEESEPTSKTAISHFAFELVHRINQITPVTTTSLICTSLLSKFALTYFWSHCIDGKVAPRVVEVFIIPTKEKTKQLSINEKSCVPIIGTSKDQNAIVAPFVHQ